MSQYPNDFAEWMEDSAREELEGFDFVSFRRWLDEVDLNNPDAIMSPPLFHEHVEPEVDEPVEVNGDVIVPSKKKKEAKKPLPKKRSRPARARGGRRNGRGRGARKGSARSGRKA